MRRLFAVARWLVDLAVVVAVIACILHQSRRRSIACAWEGRRASCAIEVESSLGRVRSDAIREIRGAAYRSKNVVGFVTDADNKGENALFGTREIAFNDEGDAERFYAFAYDHDPQRVEAREGVERPLVVTAAWLGALLLYAIVSRFAWSELARRRR